MMRPPARPGLRVASLVAAALLLLAIAGACASEPPTAVRVDGARLVDGRGGPIRLLGVNRSGAEYACMHDLDVFAGPTDARAIASMSAWGINVVRIPLNEHCWLGINGVPRRYTAARYRAAIEAYVVRLGRAGLIAVLDLHWSAPGGEPATGQQPMADLDHAPAFWSSVARTFSRNPSVVFDLFNEPYDIDWRCWRDGCVLAEGWRTAGMQTLVDVVRATGARQLIIAAGISWASDVSSWLKYRPHDPQGQLAAGFHVFDFSPCATPRCWKETVAPVARRVPVVTSEIGQRGCSDRFIDRFMNWADSAGVSYLGWGWNPAGCSAPSLIRSWSGRPTQSGRRFRDHVVDLGDAGVSPAG